MHRVLVTLSGVLVASILPTTAAPSHAAPAPPGVERAAAVEEKVLARTERRGRDRLTHTITSDGSSARLKMQRVGLRAPGFRVVVQRADGTLERQKVRPTRAYLGHLVGDPTSVAVAIRQRDGRVAGAVSVDRGATVRFVGRQVVETRGLTPPESFAWPSSEETERNVTVRPGQVGSSTRRFDLGYDLDPSFVDGQGGSIAGAMDAVELRTVQLLATYERDARLRPAMKKVVIRTSESASPYAGITGGELGATRDVWLSALERDVVDNVALLHDEGGGGVAYLATSGTSYAVSVNGGGGDIDVLRHEIGHNWGPGDNHTNGPEGATIESGNQYARFDGTELSSIFRYRDEEVASAPGRFPRVEPLRTKLPPYAALDLRDRLVSGRPVTLRPARNDHDANGDRVRLVGVDRRSELGGRLTRRDGVVTYVPPRVPSARTVDWFFYRVNDGRGRAATGVVVVRVDPA